MKLLSRLRRTTSGNYIPEIDGLRVLAILPVLMQHLVERVERKLRPLDKLSSFDESLISVLPSGNRGVELFFVLSGFVIARQIIIYENSKLKIKDSFNFWTYIKRRLTRLEPPYLIVMVSLFIFIKIARFLNISAFSEGTQSFLSDGENPQEHLLASLFYLHGIIFSSFPAVNPPAWTLEIEFQFYIIAPLLIAAGVFGFRKIKQIYALIIVFVGITLLASLAESIFLSTNNERFYLTHWILFFVAGIFLAILRVDKMRFKKSHANMLFIYGLSLIYVGDRIIISSTQTPTLGLQAILVLGVSAIFLSVFSSGVGNTFTSNKWSSTLGGMVYSLYLTHLVIFQVGVSTLFSLFFIGNFLTATVAYGLVVIPGAIIFSSIFFILIEKPCMNPNWPKQLKNRLSKETIDLTDSTSKSSEKESELFNTR